MFHIPFFIPLFVSGVVGALWRDHRQVTPFLQAISLPAPVTESAIASSTHKKPDKLFDDMSELHHYQRVSWYALAFSASGWWLFPPAILISIPLLSYSTYNFVKTLHQSDAASRISPMTAFEVVAVAGTLVTGRPLMASLMFLFVFGTRNLLLQTKNLTQIDFSHIMDSSFSKVWRVQEGVEIEVTLSELQPGDIVVIRSGDLVLVEGTVLEGLGVIRQCSLQKTMKSVPKRPGDRVFALTQMESGCLYVQRN
jgi:cation transport ATPase